MADTAADLVDRVLPESRYRQWVLTVPKWLRLRLAREATSASWVNRLVVQAIAAWQRRRARARGIRNAQTGSITFVQRFGGLLQLSVHYHLVVPDACEHRDCDDQQQAHRSPSFHEPGHARFQRHRERMHGAGTTSVARHLRRSDSGEFRRQLSLEPRAGITRASERCSVAMTSSRIAVASHRSWLWPGSIR